MKKLTTILMTTLMVVLAANAVFAAIDVNATYVSKYIWRGFDLGSPGVNNAAIQPGVSINKDGYTLGVWGSFTLGSPKGFSELDAYLDYSATLKKGLDYSIGYTYYTFPGPKTVAATTSGELYGGLTWTEVLLSPNLTVYYDHVVGGGNGLYASLSGGSEFNVGNLPVSYSLSLGYNGGQWGATPGISDLGISLSSAFDMGAVTVTPSLNYVSVPTSFTATGGTVAASGIWFGIDVAGSI